MHGGWNEAGADVDRPGGELYRQVIEWNRVSRSSELLETRETGAILDSGPGACVEPSAAAPNTVRFGVFEADLATAELRKRGRKVALQDQPFQVLALLLRRPGEIVSREDLQRALWPADTFVEFEHGVNTAIKKLRQALGDSADNPRFIETLPRKGYRFIAPVEGLATPASVPTAAPLPAPAVRPRRLWWFLAGAGLVAVVAGCAMLLLNRPEKAIVPVPVPLTSYPGFVSSPSFSPEGDRVAFTWNGPKRDKFAIYVKQIGVEEPVRLTKDPADDDYSAWSPDGRWIAFLRILSGEKSGIFLIPAVGGAARKLTEVLGGEVLGGGRMSWHPSGQWLVISDRNSTQEPLALFLLSIETGEKRRLTSPPKGVLGDFYPAVSPDGKAIVFSRGISEQGSDLYLLELSEDLRPVGEPQRITFWQRCTDQLAWWPDGNSILFASGASCFNKTLWQMAIRGPARRLGEPERLPFGGEGFWLMPAISRQGRVVYVQNVRAAHIWRMELGESHRVVNMPMNSTRLDHVPQYSPDGKRIAFASDRSGSNEIWLCDADGSNVMKLTSFGGPYVANPAWSPDGGRIALTARPGGISEIYIVNADGGRPERLRGTQSKDRLASWSRDGKWIYIGSDRTGKSQLWKVPVGGGDPVQVTKQSCGGYAVESPDGKFVYYSLASENWRNSTELWRVPVGGGEEIRITGGVCLQYFAVTERGIYFFSGWENNPTVRCFNFATRRVETVAKIEGDLAWGLSVSPDSRWLLYAAYDDAREQSDLMMVEKFR
jgi:Tol biopolymer transport system component/DNA-binding winged helix-turn-helix (wHTH) protein